MIKAFSSPALVVPALILCSSSMLAATNLPGDHSVVAGSSDTGSLSVQGNLDVAGPTSSFGSTATGDVGLELTYQEEGTVNRILLTASRATAEFLWRQNGLGTGVEKMKLSADNRLTLFDSTGAARITLKPVDGEIALSGAGGLRLADGTLLSGASSLRSTALYNASGQVVAQVDANGRINFANGLTVGTGAGAAVITPNSAAYLNQTLANLGFRETPVAATAVKSIPLSGDFYISAVTQTSDSVYVVGWTAPSGGQIGTQWAVGGFISKLNQAGAVQWVRSFPSVTFSSAVVDVGGNVVAAGSFTGTVGFPTSPATSLVSAGGSDALVVKYNSAGQPLWAKHVGGPSEERFSSVAVSATGEVAVAGSFQGSPTTGLPAGQSLTANGNSSDALVVKYDGGGQVQWARRVGGAGWDSFSSVIVDSAGKMVAVGHFSGTATDLSGPVPNLVSNGSTSDAFVMKFSATGQSEWAQRVGGTGYDGFASVTVDSADNVIAGGQFTGTATGFVGSTSVLIANGAHSYTTDAFVVKYSGVGQVQWAKRVGGPWSDYFVSVRTDASGAIIATGSFVGTTTGLATNLTAKGDQDGLLVAYDSLGGSPWATAVGGTGNESIAISNVFGSNVWAWGTVDYGPAAPLGDTRVDGAFIAGWTGFPLVTPAANSPAAMAWGGGQAKNEGVALGSSAFASGTSSTAFGAGTASGNLSIAAGLSDASGSYSAAFGTNTKASGGGALAFGEWTQASGGAAFAGGSYSQALGAYSFAFGDSATASGHNAIALGGGSIAGGYAAFAAGFQSDASGENAVALGSSWAAGYYSTALGSSSAQGEYSSALGSSSAQGEYSSALGGSVATGHLSTAMGQSFAQAYGSTSLGLFNVSQGNPTSRVATDDLLVVGNGVDYQNRANALAVHQNGNARVAGTVEAKRGFRTPPMGDIGMGSFTAGPTPTGHSAAAGRNPAGLNAGLRYTGE